MTIRLLVVALLLGMATIAFGHDWVSTFTKVLPSVVKVASDTTICTGVVVAPYTVLTAMHCLGDHLQAAGLPAVPVFGDHSQDVLLLTAALTQPPIKLAKVDPVAGDVVASIGYGFGLAKPIIRTTVVSASKIGAGSPIPRILTDAAVAPGQSGGPLVNLKGELVGLVQQTNEISALALGIEQLRVVTKGLIK